MTTKFEVKELQLHYGEFHALKKISLTVPERSVNALIGPSGCGKSTFLRTLNRMNDMISSVRVEGEIKLSGTNIYDPGMDVEELRKRVGWYFSSRIHSRNRSMRMSLTVRAFTGSRARRKWMRSWKKSLRGASLWDEVKDDLHKSALGLSGGQQQRLCIARALAVNPEVLLMDESTSALDPISTLKIEELIQELKKDYTIVMVTHNMHQAARVSDYTTFFLNGEVVESSPTEKLFSTPVDHRTEQYITGRFG